MSTSYIYSQNFELKIFVFICILFNFASTAVDGAVGSSFSNSGLTKTGRRVEIGIQAPWPTWCLSPITETAEYLAELHASGGAGSAHLYFWSYVEGLRANSHQIYLGLEDSDEDSTVLTSSDVIDKAIKSDTIDSIYATELVNLAMEEADKVLVEAGRDKLYDSFLELAVSSRAHAPAVQAFQELGESLLDNASTDGCSADELLAWAAVHVDGSPVQIICSPDKISEAVENRFLEPEYKVCTDSEIGGVCSIGNEENDIIFDFDHIFPVDSATSTPATIILYAAIGSAPFYKFHDVLVHGANTGSFKYVLRHYIPVKSNTIAKLMKEQEADLIEYPRRRFIPTDLQGFGVNLDIKHMEYKNYDDSKKDDELDGSDSVSEEEEIPENEDIQGISFSKLLKRRPDISEELRKFRKNLMDEEGSDESTTDMKVWKMMDLGLQSAQSVLSSADPVHRIGEIAQNFPSYATQLSSIKVKSKIRSAVEWARSVGISGTSSLYLNGIECPLDSSTLNIFALLKTFQDELDLLSDMRHLGLSTETSQMILEMVTTDDDDEESLNSLKKKRKGRKMSKMSKSKDAPVRINVYKGQKDAVHMLNNLEKDPEYSGMAQSLTQLMYPSYQVHGIAKNLYNCIYILDLSTQQGRDAIANIEKMIKNRYPMRFGIILVDEEDLKDANMDPEYVQKFEALADNPDEDDTDSKPKKDPNAKISINGSLLARIFSNIKIDFGAEAATNFLFAIGNIQKGKALEAADVAEAGIAALSNTKGKWKRSSQKSSIWKIIRVKDNEADLQRAKMAAFVASKGLLPNCYLVNGMMSQHLEFGQAFMMQIMQEQHYLAQLVARGLLTERSKNLYALIMKQKDFNLVNRYHPIVNMDSSAKTIQMLYKPNQKSFLKRADLKYFHKEATRDVVKPLTVMLFFDLDTKLGLQNLISTMKYFLNDQMESFPSSRISIVHNPSTSTGHGHILKYLLDIASESLESKSIVLIEAITEISKHLLSLSTDEDFLKNLSLASMKKEILALDETIVEKTTKTEIGDLLDKITLETVTTLSYDIIDVKKGEQVLLANGFRFSLDDSVLLADDLDLILKTQLDEYAGDIAEFLEIDNDLDELRSDTISDLVMYTNSFVSIYAQNPRENMKKLFDSSYVKHLLVNIEEGQQLDNNLDVKYDNHGISDLMEVLVILDPISEAAQRIAPFLMIVRDHFQMPMKILLVPALEIQEFPIKSFYRFVLGASKDYTNAIFKNLPLQHTLTTRIDTPEPWNVQQMFAIQDLDNLRCDDEICGDRGTKRSSATFRLKNLLVYGQCIDTGIRKPPNGLQLTLQRKGMIEYNEQDYSDTVVMQNLGYFQLKANPGVWDLNLAEGRADTLFMRVDALNDKIPSKLQQKVIIKRNFQDEISQYWVHKRPGMEGISLLEMDEKALEAATAAADQETTDNGGMWSTVSNFFGSGSKKVKKAKRNDETVHVFSLATGHLYERFLKIMMLSVVKRTSAPVKFWLFENYLSAPFKDVARQMAKEYNFELGFVTYKWPDWLRQQTEKQRIIWGYKILFLDVLFPLDVKKIIYVDSDQVLRADLKELWEHDLEGKPYGYTPFCDSREETLGFQFWRSGYWKTHLQGKPYHISALYVVDLQMFREKAVGDQLRSVYDQLSRDPGSLANLDQDLPNYAQHVVPIHSLPQDWLWCESWCSDKSKTTSKTIDLCNNPLHKEPKLEMAKRVVSGGLFNESWIDLDDEVKRIEASINM